MSAPRKLPDGSWSDRVNRDYPLATGWFSGENPNRWHVIRYRHNAPPWAVFRGHWEKGTFGTHAEALAFADEAARK